MASTLKPDPMRVALATLLTDAELTWEVLQMKDPTLKHVPEPTANTQARAALSAPDDREELLEGLAEAITMLEQTAYAEHHCQCPLEVEGPIGSEGCSCVDEIAPLRAILAKHQAREPYSPFSESPKHHGGFA